MTRPAVVSSQQWQVASTATCNFVHVDSVVSICMLINIVCMHSLNKVDMHSA